MTARSFAVRFPLLLFVAVMGCGSNDTPSIPSGHAMTEKSDPPPVQVERDDPDMAAAIAKARSSVDEFINALTNPEPSQSAFSVKVAVQDGDEVEHLWLVPVRYENGQFIGRVNNEPQMVSTVKFDDEVKVAKNEISDWIYADDGKMAGGFTVHVLRSAMQQEPAPDSTESVGDHELIGKWVVVSIDSGAGPAAKEGFHLDITAATITFVAPNGATKTMGHIHRIDPTSNPKQIDLRNGSDIGLGIYELDGSSLKLIVRNPGSDRPQELTGHRDGMLFMLKRN
jgi:uncharacterized protein (TIGR03067 family)